MEPTDLIPVAQYLRMSTDHQQYSLDNQADTIANYAALHRFKVVKTYSDPARSGLRLKNREGLKQLLKDVVSGERECGAVLVYDVSRWGRFQDHDEAAHYEYLCKSAGVPVHYCAEPFGNEPGAVGWILKALKRTMAGEYSRELSVKVRTGLTRLAKLGYKLGGTAPYGLRRQLLDKNGNPKQLLAFGERKSVTDERVTFVSGPPEEIAIVERIFREFADERRSVNRIAARLNGEGVPYLRGATWKGNTLRILLQDPRYIGIQVWGRTTALLATPVKRMPVSDWIVVPNVFPPIISQELFLRAQEVFATFTIRLTDDQMLDRLRQLYKLHGRLSSAIIDKSRLCPGLTTYTNRFGSLIEIYERLGYHAPDKRGYASVRQKGILVRASLTASLLNAFPKELQLARKNKRFRPLLRYRRTGLLISLTFARLCTRSRSRSWIVEARREERRRPTLLALLDLSGGKIESMKMFPKLPTTYRHLRVREGDNWFKRGMPLHNVKDFLSTLTSVRLRVKSD